MAKNEPQEADTADAGDAPLLDLNDASIKKMIARAKKRGIVTYDELNKALPQDQMSSEQIEDVMSALNDMGINVVENEEGGDDDEEEDDKEEASPAEDEVDPLDDGGPRPAAATKKEAVDRTDDPVRMYLREMGAVELLSREGEIAIAKRIEAGRDIMIWGLCESPITFDAIIDWSNALNEERMQLREILDLEAMLSKGPTAEQINASEEGEDGEGEISEKTAGPSIKEDEEPADEPEAPNEDGDEDMVERRAQPQVEEEEEDNTLSLAQMEETLKPQALEKFATITSLYKKFSQDPGDAHGGLFNPARLPAFRRKEVPEAARAAHRRGRKRPVPRQQDRISGRAAVQLQPPPDRAWRPDAAPRRAPPRPPPRLPRKLHGP